MEMRNRKNIYGTTKAFTLVELVTVLAVLAVAGGLTYLIFVTNWSAFQDRIARADLWHEADFIVETVTASARESRQVDVVEEEGATKEAVFIDSDDEIVTYTMTAEGQFQMARADDNMVILSEQLDFTNSSFRKEGKALVMELALLDEILTRMIHIKTATEIYPRN